MVIDEHKQVKISRTHSPDGTRRSIDIAAFDGQALQVDIFGDISRELPVVYLHTFGHEGEEVWNEARKMQARRFILVAIDGLDYHRHLSPWATGKLFKHDDPCEGKGAEWLQQLASAVIPQVEQGLKVSWRIIAGYSLAGLFAWWASYHTTLFKDVISVSGSFWFPGFVDFVRNHEFMKVPQHIYFSIGDKETRLKNPILNTVENHTRWLQQHYAAMGVNTAFDLNNGNHYNQVAWRIAKGITWMLKQ